MDPTLRNRIRHLHDVEHLSIRQIARQLGAARKTVRRAIEEPPPAASLVSPSPGLIRPFERLIREWYARCPALRATQVYARLKDYDFAGGYNVVKRFTRPLRRKRREIYHELTFLPGEEAQVDWMVCTFPFDRAYGFVHLLAYSRYLCLAFYPRQSFEFFLDGHLRAFGEVGGTARTLRYNNLKSVVTARRPDLSYNDQFLDFARHYRFSIHPCTPGRPNEKGRVERVIRDIQAFLEVNTFTDLADLNRKTAVWRRARNATVHRITGKAPFEALKEEHLLPLPVLPYKPYRITTVQATSTGFVAFDANRYSLPSEYAGRACRLLAYPDTVEIAVHDKTVALHRRVFDRQKTIEHPAHRTYLLARTPNFKYQRIFQVMRELDPVVWQFLAFAREEGQDEVAVAYELFKLLKGRSKETLASALREAIGAGTIKLHVIQNLLAPPGTPSTHPVHPQDARLLQIAYEGSPLDDYDDLL